MRVIKMEHTLVVKDGEILIEGKVKKAVVGIYEDHVVVTTADSGGVEIMLFEKEFAKKLAEAILEKAK